ncbi:MAG TPA: hypothetical protein V6D12_23100 [Candidatus Obscuribacterales bacterium]
MTEPQRLTFEQVNEFISKLAEEQNIDVQALVNEWLRSNIKVIKIAQSS